MSFNITSDGVLQKYNGPGGEVVIPDKVKYIDEYYVFDDDCGMTALFLPESFLGVQSDRASSYYFEDDDDEEEEDDIKGYRHIDAIHCPTLERYDVADGNPVYAQKDGVLYSKDFKVLIACPGAKSGKLVIDERVQVIREDALIACSQLTEVVLSPKMKRFDDDYDAYFSAGLATSIKVTGMNIDYISGWDTMKYVEKKSKAHNLILQFPNMLLEDAPNTFYKQRIAMGYCCNPEIYSEEQAKKYEKYLKSQRQAILNVARTYQHQEVIRYYEERGMNKVDQKKLSKLTPRKATQYLEDKILYATSKEVQEILQNCKAFEFTARALGLACRYAGIEVVRQLVDAGFDFNYAESEYVTMNKYYGTYVEGWSTVYDADYSLMVVIDRLRSHYVGASKYLPLTDEEELQNCSVLSEEERMEIVCLLCDRGILTQEDQQKILYYAVLFGNYKMAQNLWDRGIRLPDWALELVKGVVNTWKRKDFVHFAFWCYPESALMFGRLAKEQGHALRITASTDLEKFYENKDRFEQLLLCGDFTSQNRTKMAKEMISGEYIESLTVFLEHGFIKGAAQCDKLLTHAMDEECQEATAALLDYKNKMIGFGKNTLKL